MYAFKRILVGLDLSEMDLSLIRYSSMLAKTINIEKVYFIHVAKDLDLPDEITDKYPDLIAPLDESIQSDLERKIKENFEGVPAEYDIEIREGNASEKILRWAEIKEVDLMVMGRKLDLKGSGMLPGKLAKVAPCSILFIPESATFGISKVLVPVDFSKPSGLALDKALELSATSGAEVIAQNSYEVPLGYYKTGKSFEEFAEIMKGHAETDFKRFVEESKVDGAKAVKCIFTLDKEDDPAERAYEAAVSFDADLIVIGSKGRTGTAAILLGSIADKMTGYNKSIPLLVIKDKKDNLSFLEALLRI